MHLSHWHGSWKELDQKLVSNVEYHEHAEKYRDQQNNYQTLKEQPY